MCSLARTAVNFVVLKGYLNLILQKKQISIYPANIYLFKLNHGSAIAMSEICSTKTPEWRWWRRSGIFIVNFEQISHIVLVFPLLFLNE